MDNGLFFLESAFLDGSESKKDQSTISYLLRMIN